MELFLKVDINILFALLLGSVYLIARQRLDKNIALNRVFLNMSLIIILQLIVEAATFIIDGNTNGWLIPVIIRALNLFLFVGGPMAAYLWYLFIKMWITPTQSISLNKKQWILAPLMFNAFTTILSPFTGWVFSFTDTNVYQRGPLFVVPVIVCYFYLFHSVYTIIKNKQDIVNGTYVPMLIFAFVPMIGGTFQVLFYGTLMMWSSAAFSLMVIYIFLQQRMMQFDTLTGAWTKASFEHYIDHLINKEKKQDPFGIIFLDLDEFKSINDSFGHLEGDAALKTSVRLIKSCLGRNDIIARFGGDEFVIFAQKCGGNSMVDRINLMKYNFKKYNETSEKEYKLKFSCGYEVFDANKYNIWQFLNYVDNLMYLDKEAKQVS